VKMVDNSKLPTIAPPFFPFYLKQKWAKIASLLSSHFFFYYFCCEQGDISKLATITHLFFLSTWNKEGNYSMMLLPFFFLFILAFFFSSFFVAKNC
jgi:hypothetical protein